MTFFRYKLVSPKLPNIGTILEATVLSLNFSTVNCVNCKKENTTQFIADTGASDTFTFDKSDFVTFTEIDASVQTADEKSALQLLGYGTVFVKHTIPTNKKEVEVTTKTQLVYYAPGMAYQLLSIRSLLQKGYCLYGDK